MRVYKTDCGMFGGLVLEADRNKNTLEISNEYTEDSVSVAIDKIPNIINMLNNVYEDYNYKHKIGNSITVISGKFAGMTGIIEDIDNVATERELVVHMDKTDDNDPFYAFIDKDNVE